MLRFLVFIFFSFLPILAWSEYDPRVIKQGITERSDTFQVESWRTSDDGEATIANTSLEGVIISVGKNNSGIIASLKNSQQAVPAMIRCITLGEIGMSPENDAQWEKIKTTIADAAQSQSTKSLVMNKIKYEVTPVEAAGNVFLSCILSPNP